MQYNVGDIIKVRVSGLASYGIFVTIDEHYTGLIHISEVSLNFVRNVQDYVRLGDYIMAKIIGVDEEAGHLKLSIKDIDYTLGKEREINEKENSGFTILKESLPKWIEEKKREYDIK